MVFSSAVFLCYFLPAVLAGYWLLSRKEAWHWGRNAFLLLMSLLFYAWGEPVFVFLMLFSIVVTWQLGLWLSRATGKNKKRILTAGISLHVLLLFVFKYLTFAASQLGLLLGSSFATVQLELPIGISFFTFQLMSYLFDIYYGRAVADKSLLRVALYISLFPALIAGPIVRYETIAAELVSRHVSRQDVTEGFTRFAYGLGKKVLIANYLAQIADSVFDCPGGELSIGAAWLGAICYTLQIYFDFSGYSDMAIGIGRMLGFHFPENFNYPYIAKSATEFWRRWHMSLTAWFRDYVYIPLGGNRVSRSRWVCNLFAVWLLTGIWHGANWTFILWGLLYFAVQLAEKVTDFPRKLGRLAHVYALVVITTAWVIFRAPDIGYAASYIFAMYGGGAGMADTDFWDYLGACKWVLLAGIVLSTPVYEKLQIRLSKYPILKDRGEAVLLAAVFLLAFIGTVGSSYNPFIYFNF